MTEEKDFELKSEAMNDMLSLPPKWVVRSGSGVFLIIILSVIGLAWFIQYPDEISGEVVVTTSKAPIELTNQTYIQLKSLDATENKIVQAGELIAQFDIQANPKDIADITKYLLELDKLDDEFKQIPIYHSSVQLGTLQEQWTTLSSRIDSWNSELNSNAVQKEVNSIRKEISLREQLQAINNERIKISANEYELIKDELASSERLAQQNAISKQTLLQDKRSNSQALQGIQNQKEQQVQNLITLNSLRNQLNKLEHESWLNHHQKKTEILVGINSLQNSLNNWEKNSVWVAPCSGKVMFNKILQVNRFYKPNEASLVIVPNGSNYNALATITSAGAGKVKPGQKVFIELVDYPKNEFGMLEGKVAAITQIDKEGKYAVKISLPTQLKTTYNKQIPFKAQLRGTAKIITKDKRLLARFFEQLTSILK
jgi:hypothetical protein